MALGPAPGYDKHPDHRVTLERTHRHVDVSLGGELIAKADEPLLVEETQHEPVFYISHNDIQKDKFFPSGKQYDCPFKGHANYYSVRVGDKVYEDVAWSYEEPYDEVKELENHFAFDPQKVDEIRAH